MIDTQYIKMRRKQLGLTQKQAAKLAGIATHVHWSRLESGTVKDAKLSTLAGVAKALKCKVTRLLVK